MSNAQPYRWRRMRAQKGAPVAKTAAARTPGQIRRLPIFNERLRLVVHERIVRRFESALRLEQEEILAAVKAAPLFSDALIA